MASLYGIGPGITKALTGAVKMASPTPKRSLTHFSPTSNHPGVWAPGAAAQYPNAGTGTDTTPAAPPAPDYYAQYQKSIADARAGIEGQFRSALADLGQREGLANQAVGLLPGQVNDIYAKSAANITQGANTLDAAEKGTNLQSFTPAAAQLAPLSAAVGMDQGARLADVPLLKLGTTASFQQQRGALQNAQLSATDDINKEERGYLSQLDQMNRQAAIDAQTRADQRGSDVADRNWLAEQDFNRQQRAQAIQGRQARDEEARANDIYGGQDTTAERGQFLRNFRPDRYRQATSSAAYRAAERSIGSEKKAPPIGDSVLNHFFREVHPSHVSLSDAINSLKKRGLYRTAAALAFRHSSKLGQPTPTK